jgi:hypothetical protein
MTLITVRYDDRLFWSTQDIEYLSFDHFYKGRNEAQIWAGHTKFEGREIYATKASGL